MKSTPMIPNTSTSFQASSPPRHHTHSSPFATAYHQTDDPLDLQIQPQHKPSLPLFDPSGSDTQICPYSHHLDPFGDHIFQCMQLCKIVAHNSIDNSFATTLAPLLSMAGYLLPTSTVDVEPLLYLPSDPHAWPFNLSFNPDPVSPPQVNHTSPYTTIGFYITISCPPPYPILTGSHPSWSTFLRYCYI